MSEGNVYEAACEVREAISGLDATLADGLAALAELMGEGSSSRLDRPKAAGGRGSRRDQFAAAIMAELVKHDAEVGGMPPPELQALAAKLARKAWFFADALDLADPLAETADPAAPAASEGIDLSEEPPGDKPTLDDIYGRRPK